MTDDLLERRLAELVNRAWDALMWRGEAFESFADGNQAEGFRRALRRRARAVGWRIQTGRPSQAPARVWARLPEWEERADPRIVRERKRQAAEALRSIFEPDAPRPEPSGGRVLEFPKRPRPDG